MKLLLRRIYQAEGMTLQQVYQYSTLKTAWTQKFTDVFAVTGLMPSHISSSAI
jgi:hypothetical protein